MFTLPGLLTQAEGREGREGRREGGGRENGIKEKTEPQPGGEEKTEPQPGGEENTFVLACFRSNMLQWFSGVFAPKC